MDTVHLKGGSLMLVKGLLFSLLDQTRLTPISQGLYNPFGFNASHQV